MLRPALLLMAALGACRGDETVSAYAGPGPWRLVSIDGAPYAAGAVLEFPEAGIVEGEAPCNRFSAAQTAPYPWLDLGPVAATRRACLDLDAEQAFFEALGAMTLAEAQGDVLILSNDAGREMVFEAAD